MCVQLAAAWGAKVIATITTSEEFNYLQDLNLNLCTTHTTQTHTHTVLIHPHAGRIIDLSSESLVDAVMDETGSLGADCIIGAPSPVLRVAWPSNCACADNPYASISSTRFAKHDLVRCPSSSSSLTLRAA